MNNTSTNNKRIAKNTLFMYMRMFLVMLVSLFTVRVLLRILGVEDYGVYNAIAGVVTSLSFVSSILFNLDFKARCSSYIFCSVI